MKKKYRDRRNSFINIFYGTIPKIYYNTKSIKELKDSILEFGLVPYVILYTIWNIIRYFILSIYDLLKCLYNTFIIIKFIICIKWYGGYFKYMSKYNKNT